MEPVISIGPIEIHFFGIMIAIGIIVGTGLFLKELKRRKMDTDTILDGVLYSVLAGVIGARLFFVFVYNPAYYFENPMQILFIHQGGLSIHGGIVGGLLTGFFFMRKKKLPVWKVLDVAAPSIILAQGISRIGCDVFGVAIPDWWPFGIEHGGEIVHPAQAYEFILNYILFGYLWLRLKSPRYHGQVFLHYLIGFMIIRGIVEFSRENPMVIGPFSVSHVMSFIGVGVGIYFISVCKKRQKSLESRPIKSSDLLKTAAIVVGLSVISILVYFGFQG